MTMFWVYAALLTAVALAILVTPLLRNRTKDRPSLSRDASNLAVFRDQLATIRRRACFLMRRNIRSRLKWRKISTVAFRETAGG